MIGDPVTPGLPVLVAEDDPAQRVALTRLLAGAGYVPMAASDGPEAVRLLEADDPPRLCLLDWEMPGMSGVDVCRWIRRQPRLEGAHVLLVTGRGGAEDVLEALEAGANDHVRKPFQPGELLARIASGARVVQLQSRLDAKITELERALGEIRQIRGLIPICAHCHRIRDDAQQWQRLEAYFERHTDASFSHSICDECLERHYPKRGAAPNREGSSS